MKRIVTAVESVLVVVALVPPPAKTEQAAAEKKAGEYWGKFYRGDKSLGCAYIDPTNGLCYVGVCDGKADKPGYTRRAEGGPGAYYNTSTDARFKTHDGRWYANASWFGKGKTWEEAFKNATEGGFPDLRVKD